MLCLCLTPLVRNVSHRWGVLDCPDGVRKTHQRPIPRAGGIPIVISCAAAYALLMLSPLAESAFIQEHIPLMWHLLPAAGLVFLIGLVDDIISLRPPLKLAGQIGAAVLAYVGGVRILSIQYHALNDWWSLALTTAPLAGSLLAFLLYNFNPASVFLGDSEVCS